MPLVVLALGLGAGSAEARKAGVGKDRRPNILVVMTDDQAAADVAHMPNVKRLLARQGTSFVDAVDSFPLCCPSRATFITGQYAHNHGVAGNFHPYGWYGMKNRRNTLPRWLQKSGYRTALVGKWLNGYGARDARGEVPVGFDNWRGLLDVSAYDYYNFVMNINGRLKTWGDPAFARALVRFANIEVRPEPGGVPGVLAELRKQFGPPPYEYWGAEHRQDYSPDVTGRVAEELVRRERRSKKPFFLWWSPAAPHREDVATTLMNRPGPDPRAPKRYLARSLGFKLPRGPSFNEADLSDKPSNLTKAAPKPMSEELIRELELDYQGRMGSLLAVDDHVRRLLSILRSTKQLSNTVVVFTSDNGWLQGQHRVSGDKFLPYEESIRVPLIVRGPGVPRRQDHPWAGLQHRFRAHAAGLRAGQVQGQADARRRLAAAHDPRPAAAPQPGAPARGTGAAVRGQGADQRLGPPVQGRAHRPLHLRRLHGDRGAGAVRPAGGPGPATQRRRRSGLRTGQEQARTAVEPSRALPGALLQRQTVRA